jgi:opacity protein-like surface antigen
LLQSKITTIKEVLMKKLLTPLTVAVVFLLASSICSQVPFSIYGGGFMSFPSSPGGFKSEYKNGFHGMVGLGLKSAPGLQLVPKIEYHKFGRDYSFGNLSGVDGGSEAIWLFGADLRLGPHLPGSPIKPYALAGIGLARVTYAQFAGINSTLVDDLNAHLPNSKSPFYYNLGGGLEFAFLPEINLFVQARYVSVATGGGGSKFVPITVGVKIF